MGANVEADGQFLAPGAIAIDCNQRYVFAEVGIDRLGRRAIQFPFRPGGASNGRFQTKWPWRPLLPPDPPFSAAPNFIAQEGHEIYVTGGTSFIGGGERLRVFDRDGTFLPSWISRLQSALGVAVNGDQVYVASDTSVLVFDRQGTLLRSFGSSIDRRWAIPNAHWRGRAGRPGLRAGFDAGAGVPPGQEVI